MPRSGYPDVDWFLRAMRVVPVIAGAALLGGMIGGFAIFAIDSALTWEPVSQRPEARADNQASALDQHATKPVRIVGGAIPDPSAGMSGPPPAPQPQRSSVPAQPQISAQLLTPKPLGPASRLQPQTAMGAPASGAAQPQNQTANQPQIQAPVQMQNAAAAQQQPTRWPDALSRAHQNAAYENATNAQQQAPPPPAAAQTGERTANKNSETDRKEANSDHAATTDDQDRSNTRYGRHSRRHAIFGTNGWRNGGDDDASAAAPSPRRQDARAYDRLYDSYGNRRDRSYSTTRERPYGDAREDQNDAAYRSNASRSDTGRYGRDAGYRNRSRVITREQPEETDRTFEARQPRSEPFWGGDFSRRGDGYQPDDD